MVRRRRTPDGLIRISLTRPVGGDGSEAMYSAILPPLECPTIANRPGTHLSSNCRMASECSGTPQALGGGGLRPWPGRSRLITWKTCDSQLEIGRIKAALLPHPWSSSTLKSWSHPVSSKESRVRCPETVTSSEFRCRESRLFCCKGRNHLY